MSQEQQQQQEQVDKSHYRMTLHNWAGKLKLGTVEYFDEEIKEGSLRVWKSTVQVNGTDKGNGEGSKKGEAREMAAKEALNNIGLPGPVNG